MVRLKEQVRKKDEKTIQTKVNKLQRKVSQHPGELISILTTHYGIMRVTSHTYNPDYYLMEAYLQTGLLTSDSRIFPNDSFLVAGVKNPYIIDLDTGHDRDFEKLNGNSFAILEGYGHGRRSIRAPLGHLIGIEKNARSTLSYLSNEEFNSEYIAKNTLRYRGRKPAAWVKIGNEEAIPFLQKVFLSSRKSWRYTELSKLLGVELPISSSMNVNRLWGVELPIGKSIREDLIIDQLAIHWELIDAETLLPKLKLAKEELLKKAEESDGLISDIAINVNYGGAIRDTEAKIERLIKTAIKRGYHESGFCIETRTAPGVSKRIDFKEFFSKEKEEYGF